MTQKELNEYNALSADAKVFYDLAEKNHPNWSHQQRFVYATICMQDPFGSGPEPPSNIFKKMLEKAQNFLQENFPGIYATVADVFSTLLRRLRDAIHATMETIKGWLNELFG